MEHISSDDLLTNILENLKQNKNESHIAFSFSPNKWKEFIISTTMKYLQKDIKVQGGIATAGEGNTIKIEGIQISIPWSLVRLGRKVTVDLIMQNEVSVNNQFPTGNIKAFIQDHKTGKFINTLSQHSPGILLLESRAAFMNSYVDNMKSLQYSSWLDSKIYIADGKVRVEFEKATGISV